MDFSLHGKTLCMHYGLIFWPKSNGFKLKWLNLFLQIRSNRESNFLTNTNSGVNYYFTSRLFLDSNEMTRSTWRQMLLWFFSSWETDHNNFTCFLKFQKKSEQYLNCAQIHQIPSLQSTVRDVNINSNISNFFTRPELLFHSFYNSVLLLYTNTCLICDYFDFT